MRFPVRALTALAAASVLAGCGGGDAGTPEAALRALVEAANSADDEAVAALLCPEALTAGATTLAQTRADAVAADPALDDFGYALTAGEITDATGTTAAGTVTVEVRGTDDATPAGDDFLNRAPLPRPLTLIGDNGEVALVKRDGTWLICDATTE